MTAYRAPADRDLGPVRARHFVGRWSAFEWLFASVIILISPATWVVPPHEISPTDLLAVRIVAGVLALGVVGLISRSLRWRNDEVVIHEQGCVQRTKDGDIAFAWDDVAACRTEPIVSTGLSRYTRFQLRLRDGTKLTLPRDGGAFAPDASIKGSATFVHASVGRVLIRAARRAFGEGQALQFSDVEAHADRGLVRQGEVLAWSDLTGFEVDDGVLFLQRGDKPRWALIAEAVENLDLLLVLLSSRGLPAEAD